MIIEIQGREYTANRDNNGWELKAPYTGQDKDKNPKTQYRTYYYGKFEQVCKKVIDLEMGYSSCECDALTALREIKEQLEGLS